jgi:hypothetical protein
MHVTLTRDLKVPLEFEGWVLAEVSTHIPGKERWTELRVWAVDPDVTDTMWVLETVGQTIVPGEKIRRDAIPCQTLEELVSSLSKHGQLTAPGRSVLDLAMDADEELRYSYENRTTTETEKL